MTATLGEVYKGLGLYPQANALARASLDTRTRALGPEATDTLESTLSFASILREQGKPKEAETLLRPALDIADCRLGPESLLALRMRSLLDWTVADGGDLATAERMSRETLATMERVLGAKHPVTWKQQGMPLHRARRGSAAGQRPCRSTARRWPPPRRGWGPDAPDTLVALGNLAGDLSNLGRRDEALPLMRELVERQRRVLGPEHSRTLFSARQPGSHPEVDEAARRGGRGRAPGGRGAEARPRPRAPRHPGRDGAPGAHLQGPGGSWPRPRRRRTRWSRCNLRAGAEQSSARRLPSTTWPASWPRRGKRDRAIEVLRDAVDHGLLIGSRPAPARTATSSHCTAIPASSSWWRRSGSAR